MGALISGITSVFRPAAKQIIKGGLVVSNTAWGLATETEEEFRSLVKEARTELNESRAAKTAELEVEAKGLRDRFVDAGHAVWDAASKMLSTANEALVTMVAWIAGESREKARRQVEKGEQALEDFGKDITKEECAIVIELLIVAAV